MNGNSKSAAAVRRSQGDLRHSDTDIQSHAVSRLPLGAAGLLLWEAFASARRQLAVSGLAEPDRRALYDLAVTGELAHHAYVSGLEFFIGYSSASLIGILARLADGQQRDPAKRILQPWISGLYATPTIALGPLFILWFGIGIWSKIIVVIILVLFPVTINTEAGICARPARA